MQTELEARQVAAIEEPCRLSYNDFRRYGRQARAGNRQNALVPPMAIEKKQTPMPTIAGILVIVSGAFKLLIVLAVLGLMAVPVSTARYEAFLGVIVFLPLLLIVALAIVAGVFSLQRRLWGWALAGAIVSILPFSFLGIAATVLLALSKDEFD